MHGTTDDLVMELCNLQQGSYIVYMEVEWVRPELINSFVLSAYADQPITLEAADKNEYYSSSSYGDAGEGGMSNAGVHD